MIIAPRRVLLLSAAALGAALGSGPVPSDAQVSAGAPQTVPEQRQAPETRPGDATGPQQGTSTPPSGSLSNELNRSGGVLQPPATGDQGVVAPPQAGPQATPVIPPPGTPGGNQQVQPK